MLKIKSVYQLMPLLLIACLALFQTVHVAAQEAPKVVKVTLDDSQSYSPGGHFNMEAMRLHNAALGTSKGFSISFSIFHPGGGADQSSRNSESVYYVVEGELTITTPDGDLILSENESVYRPVGSIAGIINNSGADVKMLVISPSN